MIAQVRVFPHGYTEAASFNHDLFFRLLQSCRKTFAQKPGKFLIFFNFLAVPKKQLIWNAVLVMNWLHNHYTVASYKSEVANEHPRHLILLLREDKLLEKVLALPNQSGCALSCLQHRGAASSHQVFMVEECETSYIELKPAIIRRPSLSRWPSCSDSKTWHHSEIEISHYTALVYSLWLSLKDIREDAMTRSKKQRVSGWSHNLDFLYFFILLCSMKTVLRKEEHTVVNWPIICIWYIF